MLIKAFEEGRDYALLDPATRATGKMEITFEAADDILKMLREVQEELNGTDAG